MILHLVVDKKMKLLILIWADDGMHEVLMDSHHVSFKMCGERVLTDYSSWYKAFYSLIIQEFSSPRHLAFIIGVA